MEVQGGKLNIYRLVNVPSNSSNLKTNVDHLDIDKLTTVPIVLKKISDLKEKKRCSKFNKLNVKADNLKNETPNAYSLIQTNKYKNADTDKYR